MTCKSQSHQAKLLPCPQMKVLAEKGHNNWRGAWKKALSYVWLTTRFSFQIALYLLVKQKENVKLHQVSLRALFYAFLQLMIWPRKKNYPRDVDRHLFVTCRPLDFLLKTKKTSTSHFFCYVFSQNKKSGKVISYKPPEYKLKVIVELHFLNNNPSLNQNRAILEQSGIQGETILHLFPQKPFK